jgi:hypothetical protein
MIKAEYLENAVRLEHGAAKIKLPNLKAVLLKQAEIYRKLGAQRAGYGPSFGRSRHRLNLPPPR